MPTTAKGIKANSRRAPNATPPESRTEPSIATSNKKASAQASFHPAVRYEYPDGWTAVTADLARSAQFEHTVLRTETGVEVLTV